jgi:hypothetical protein
MALESKPLFHPEVIRQQVRAFNLPERVADWQPKLQTWADLIASGRADDFKETALLPDFLTDIFCGLLGYTGPAGASGVAADGRACCPSAYFPRASRLMVIAAIGAITRPSAV